MSNPQNYSPEDYIRNCTHPTDNPCEVGYRNKRGEPIGELHTCCVDCWNAFVHARRAQQKAERQAEQAKLPKCDRCGKRPWAWQVAGHKLCGYCKSRTMHEHEVACAKMGGFTMLLAGGRLMADTSTWAINRLQQTSLVGEASVSPPPTQAELFGEL